MRFKTLTHFSSGIVHMRENSADNVASRRRRRKSSSPFTFIIVLLGLAAAIFAYSKYKDKLFDFKLEYESREEIATPGDGVSTPEDLIPSTASGIPVDTNVTGTLISSAEGPEIPESNHAPTADESFSLPLPSTIKKVAETTQNDRVWAENQKAITNIELFYTKLDEQQYLKPFGLTQPSQTHFSNLIQKLLDNPPIVSGETDDLFNILQNTAHFFRIVGKNNILIMKAILDKEKDSFEEVLADYFTLAYSPEYLQEGFGITMNEESLYDYAGFFLTTMGGRLYLFRRDSVSRMVVSYYSILIVEEANRRGSNSHGIDIRPGIAILISELENSGAQLKLKEEYLDTLYDLKMKYL